MTTQACQIILLCLLTLLIGCKKRDPQPHLRDPIYSDLSKEHNRHLKMVEEQAKEVAKLQAEFDQVQVRTIDKRIKSRDLQKAKDQLQKLEQGAEYFRIRAELRRVYAKKDYTEAYEKGEEWPDPKEFEIYMTNKRLRNVSLNWSERVPKASHQQTGPKETGGAETLDQAAEDKLQEEPASETPANP